MQAEELRKYDKETLVQYFVQNLKSDCLKSDLDQIQSRLRFDALNKRSGEILDEMRKISNSPKIEDQTRWNELFKELRKLSAKIDKILGIKSER